VKALSLFSNVGVAETYLKECGVEVVVANELLEPRAQFYRHLYPSVNLIQGDITDKSIFDSVISAAKKEKIDLLLATPPCQGMSESGYRNPYDERNSLVKYAVDAVLRLRPTYVLLENVPQQLTTPIMYNGVEMMIPQYIEERLGNIYSINTKKLINAMYYGVPQMRERAIFLLVDSSLKREWSFPKPDNTVITLETAFKGIPDLWPNVKELEYRKKLPKNGKDALSFNKWHQPMTHVWRNIECMLYTPSGKTAFNNPIHYPKKNNGQRVKGYETTYRRMCWDKPGHTISTFSLRIGSQSNVHPGRPWKKDSNGDMMYTNPRALSIYELLLVSSLPVNWDIPRWATDNLIRTVIGEGIPPLLIKRIISAMPR
jgi:DNA (cytosine-5)-methyltransferase 1